MLDWSTCPAVERDPEKVSGAWVFRGTRVAVHALFENLENGARIEEFLEWFPGVSREQVEMVLEHAKGNSGDRVREVGKPSTDRWERFDRLQRNLQPFLRGRPKPARVQRFRTYADLEQGRYE
jgi:uncharacterized protein (DUF433 family)